ncbi:TetR/AcrR family transcriptional regulator [Streptomyces sp. NPDC046759]|uniref:TetR/AcrR family transcriptional regulator n=1 Tax=Streptomyces sp. NPDC046759 TaxID=3155019 RepID=UPI00340ED383
MNSARTLFIERGYHATSISDICGHANLTRGAFYSNYRSKEDLFLALYDTETDRILGNLERAAHDDAGGESAARRVLELLATHRRDDEQWFLASMEFTLHAGRNPGIAAELAPREDRLIAGMVRILSGLLHDTAPQDRRDIALLVTAMHEGITAREIIHGASAVAFRERIIPRVLSAITAG